MARGTCALVFSAFVAASSTSFGTAGECAGALASVDAVLECVRLRAPEAIRKRAAAEEAKSQAQAARRLVNPQFNAQGFRSTGDDPAGDAVQASLLFPVDAWGVRRARTRLAEASRKSAGAAETEAEQNAQISAFLMLARIRVLDDAKRNESVQAESLRRLIQAFRRRPSLSPESQANLTALEIALVDQELKLEIQRQDREGLAHELETMLGREWEPPPEALPPERSEWPELPALSVVFRAPSAEAETKPAMSYLQGPTLARLRAMREQADAEIEMGRAQKMPSIAVGPSGEWTRTFSQSGVRVGAILQMELPIMGGRRSVEAVATAVAGRLRAEAEAEEREALNELEHSGEVYVGAAKALARLEPSPAVYARASRVAKQFERGLVSGAALLETLRQARERMSSRSQLEARALEARCRVLSALGRLQECFR